ncbi:MAG: hypothetical protein ACREQL_14305 [Candidatus Binatia bacterium]
MLGFMMVSESAAVAATAQYGVFATISGKRFKAPGTGNPSDRCVNGSYMTSGGVVLGALECHGRHRKSRKNPKFVALACGIVDPALQPGVPPFEANCIAAGYTEFKTRHGIPVSMKEWISTLSLQPGPGGTLIETSSVRIRIDSFDGTYVRGAFFGVFETPQQPGTPPTAPISGEGTFYLPVKSVE